MTRINLHEAKAKFAYYTRRVKAGETIVLCDRNKPFAEIRPLPPTGSTPKPSRKIGTMKDWVIYCSEDFNDPLPELETAVDSPLFPPVLVKSSQP